MRLARKHAHKAPLHTYAHAHKTLSTHVDTNSHECNASIRRIRNHTHVVLNSKEMLRFNDKIKGELQQFYGNIFMD